ncbi:MAG: FAD:protein FMN transferase [Rhodospirillaceae bacterium]|nr:FAD:protein FMN transferase [Rhodospirillales bacterium]
MTLTRRHFLAFSAAAAAVVPFVAFSGKEKSELVRWTGRVLGRDGEIRLYHGDGAIAREAMAAATVELTRLEAIFSLSRPGSALVRLNQQGRLDAPPPDLVRVLGEAALVSQLSGGSFDVTVQPLWLLHASSRKRTGLAPSPAELAAARSLLGGIQFDQHRIILPRPGMAVTLNGLVQGYLCDRVSEVLAQHGIIHSLVDLGTRLASGPSPWPVSIRDPRHRTVPLRRLDLAQGAMASSEALSSSFPGYGKYGHLIEPFSGEPALAVPSVTVWASSAMRADALSTAIAVAGPARAAAILAAGGAARGMLVAEDGTITEFCPQECPA